MKLISSLIVLCLLVFSSCSDDDNASETSTTYIEIPDTEFESILVKQGIDSDGKVNQQILRTDAEQVFRLDLNKDAASGTIADLTGIEGFINITYLSAARQEIENVDLSVNTKLDTLYMFANYLSTIDLGKNTELMEVDVQSNELTSITGLVNATKLKKLNVSFNNLTELRVNNSTLEVLHASHNLLTNCNMTEAIKLRNILLTSNQLSGINISSNVEIETLLISDNKLDDINLENNSELTHLYISSNQLGNLDVSSNTNLIDLRADRNPNLKCVKILSNQDIPTVHLSDYQELNSNCN